METTNNKAALLQQDGFEITNITESTIMKNNNAFTIKIDDKNGIGFDSDFTVFNRGVKVPASNTIYKKSLKELRGVLSRKADREIYERIGTISKRVSKLLSDDVKEQGAYLTRVDGEIYITSVLVDFSNGAMMGELSHFSKRAKNWSFDESKDMTKIEFVKETCAWTGSKEATRDSGEYYGDYWSISFMTEEDVIVPVVAKKVAKEEKPVSIVAANDEIEKLKLMMQAMCNRMNDMETRLIQTENENKHLKEEIEILKEVIRENNKEEVKAPEVKEVKKEEVVAEISESIQEVEKEVQPEVEAKPIASVTTVKTDSIDDLDELLGVEENHKPFVPQIPDMDEFDRELLNIAA
ncbi:hypothetical protein [Escherichia coli]|uniref:hypothetical protein n=1 Tax=Escherichia coli TaxID=562 RepID=UPI001C9A4ADC|nr:hypothetical protein [Escherichia coli]MBY7288610.1 hypothetical protein [Escherichia coli]MBY7636228.1 hypothetical protein [Escherichia coli]